MKKYVVLLVFFLCLLSVPVYARNFDALHAQPSESVVRVFILYDPDGDGNADGVGDGVFVEATQGGEVVALSLTKSSEADFILPIGFYRFTAWVPSTRFFYRWQCSRLVEVVNEPTNYVVIDCIERFIISIPFLEGFQ